MNHRDTKDTEEIQENVFGFENPEECNCRLWIYDKSHSTLEIKVYCPNTQKDFSIHFGMVEYFSGAVSWVGAKFSIQPKQVCFALFQKYRPQFAEFFIKNDLMDKFSFCLYSVDTREGSVIQIIAAIGGVVDRDEI
jgi:hypothetical protein